MQGGCRSIDSGTKFLWLFVTFSGFTLWDSHPNNSPTLTLWTHPRLWLGEKLVHNGWVRFILLCCTDQCVLSALEDRQTHTSKVCTAPGVCRDLGSNWEMRSTQQQGLSGEFKDPFSIAPHSGQFCWKIYTLINPTFHFYPEQCCKELVQWPSDTAPVPAGVLCPGPGMLHRGRQSWASAHWSQFLTAPCCWDLCASTWVLIQLLKQLGSWVDEEGHRCSICVWLAKLTYIWAALGIGIILVCLVITAKKIKARNKLRVIFLNLVPADEVWYNGAVCRALTVVNEQEEERHIRMSW